MAANHQLNLPPLEVRKFDRKASAAGCMAGAWNVRAMEQATVGAMSMKEALYILKMDRAQLRREFGGDGHFSALRFGLMPEQVFRNYCMHVAQHFKWNYAVIQGAWPWVRDCMLIGTHRD